MTNLVASYPAHDIVEAQAATGSTVQVRAGDQFAVFSNMNFEGRYGLVTAGSVVAFTLEYNEDPIAAYNRAVERKEATHWFNLNATSLTSHKQERKTYRALYVGQMVRFEGRLFRIDAAPNRNFKLTEMGQPE